MSLEITGKLLVKYDALNVTQTFKTREFVLELAEEINGNTYTNFAKMQLVQNKCEILDRFNIGDLVKVSFNIRGRSYVDKKDGATKYISNMDAWRVENASAVPANAQGGPANAYNPQQNYNNPAPNYNNPAPNYNNPAPNYNNPNPNYNPAPNYNNPAPNYNQGGNSNFKPAPNYNAPAEPIDDLPF